VIRVNLKGTFLCGQTAARHMVQAGVRGTIINMSSVKRRRGAPSTGPLCRLEGRHFHADQRVWRSHLAPHGIRVNGIGPGTVKQQTPINANFFSMPGMIERFLMRTAPRAHRRGRRDRERRGVPGLGRVFLSDRHHPSMPTGGRLALNGIMARPQ
jgi:NAD(P)-dependent dehydrogenase (short-subunit alcohol dehydrogenase family)